VSPEPEELVLLPKPAVEYLPLEGVAVQAALEESEVDVAA
jgi:hypothetical protein